MRNLLFSAACLALLAGAPARAADPTQVSFQTAAKPSPADVDFLFRLGMLEGHMMVGHDLLAAHRNALALPHFGHPVRELYEDVADYITAHRIAPFDVQLIRLEAAVASDPNGPATETLYQQTLATVHAARETVPAALRNSVPEMIRVCADTIDAASGEYGEALDRGQVVTLVEYHDSRGFISYVAQELEELKRTHSAAMDQDTLGKFQAVLARAQWIVDPLIPSPQPRASVSQYRAVASQAASIVSK